jgi:hypothetical protein
VVEQAVQKVMPGAESESDSPTSGAQYCVGDRVRHRIYGPGTVVNSTLEHGNELVDVLFDERFGRKTLDASFARLEKI